MKKKLEILCLAIMMAMFWSVAPMKVEAAKTEIQIGNVYPGTTINNIERYKLNLNSSGKIIIKMSTEKSDGNLVTLLDNNTKELGSVFCNTNSSNGMGKSQAMYEVLAGTYYLTIAKGWKCQGGDYNLIIEFEDSNESFVETFSKNDNSMQSSNSIETNKEYKGHIGIDDGIDWYKFTLSSASKVTFNATSNFELPQYNFSSEDGSWGNRIRWVRKDAVSGMANASNVYYLPKGTYYFNIAQQIESDERYCVGNYSFIFKTEAVSESFSETMEKNDNSLSTANAMELNKTYNGMLSINNDKDFYKFTLSKKENLMISAQMSGKDGSYNIYNSKGTPVYEKPHMAFWDVTQEKGTIREEVRLDEGTYYIVFQGQQGTYSFNVEPYVHSYKVNLSKKNFTYNGKMKAVTVTVTEEDGTIISPENYEVIISKGRKNVGTYKVTIKFKGVREGDIATTTFQIVPEKTSISKIKAMKKGFKVAFKKKTKQITGYQIQSATNKKFKGAKSKFVKKNKITSITMKKLKAKKKYYVRVRTYKTVKGKKIYSSWSKVKTIKTK